MFYLPLSIFTESEDFPFFIQYGYHYDDDCQMHGHTDFSELVIVLEGRAEHLVGKEKYPISKGEVFVINKDTEHGYNGASNFKICNIMFKPEIMHEKIFNIKQTAGFQALFVVEPQYLQNRRFCSRLCLNTHDFATVKKMIEQMIDEYSRKEDGWQTVVYTLFIQLCVMLSKTYQQSSADTDREVMKLSRAIAYIEKNFCEDISVSELAAECGYSERQLSRLFKLTFSATPNLYITNLRMQKAQQLLGSTDMSVGEVSWNCGYDDQNYFSRVFRKHVGTTPTKFRLK